MAQFNGAHYFNLEVVAGSSHFFFTSVVSRHYQSRNKKIENIASIIGIKVDWFLAPRGPRLEMAFAHVQKWISGADLFNIIKHNRSPSWSFF